MTRERLKNNLLDGNYTRLVEAGRLSPQLLEPVLAVIGTRDMSADDLQDDVEALDMDEGVRTCSKRRLGGDDRIIADEAKEPERVQLLCSRALNSGAGGGRASAVLGAPVDDGSCL